MQLAQIAMLYFGTPYVYGGNNPTTGLDCSGLVCECLRTVGRLGKEDLNAQMIFNKYLDISKSGEIKENTILFFGRDFTSISHIAIALDENFMIEAGGEGKIQSDEGYVRIRPISWRNDFLTSINL